ncbi:hypothetical protein ACHAQA_005064 [Verticillium albo-atrum]
MKVSVIPASAQTCREAIETLLADGSVEVIGYYRDLRKAPEHFTKHANFTAVQGDLSEPSTLDFKGSTAILTLSPPKLDGSDYVAVAKEVANNVRQAAQKSGSVQRLVYVSSMGAQFDDGVGEVRTNNASETIYQGSVPEVVLVRNGYFMENWRPALDTIMTESPHFYSTVTPLDYKLPMISVRDIGRTCAREILSTYPSNKASTIVNLHGPEWYSTRDVQLAFEKVTGKKIEVKLVQRDQLIGFYETILPQSIVADFVEMTEAFLEGGIMMNEDWTAERLVKGADTLVDAFTGMLPK